MDHPEFHRNLGPFSLKQISDFLDADLECQDEAFLIYDFNNIDECRVSDITFLNDNYINQIDSIEGKTFIISKNNKTILSTDKNILKVDNVHLAIAKLSNFFFKTHDEDFIKSLKFPNLKSNCDFLDNTAIISNGVILGKNAIINSGVYIGHNCTIGKNVIIENNTVITNSIIGDNVRIGRNCSIGQPGFGFAINKTNNEKIFHKGRVILQNNIQIGSNCCIDRGSFSDTIIGENTFLDNMCHVAHNVTIGNNCIFAACLGIAGSAKIGNFVLAGGQVGINGHIKIGDRVRIAAKSGVFSDVGDGESVMGNPAINKFKYIKKNFKKHHGKKVN